MIPPKVVRYSMAESAQKSKSTPFQSLRSFCITTLPEDLHSFPSNGDLGIFHLPANIREYLLPCVFWNGCHPILTASFQVYCNEESHCSISYCHLLGSYLLAWIIPAFFLPPLFTWQLSLKVALGLVVWKSARLSFSLLCYWAGERYPTANVFPAPP